MSEGNGGVTFTANPDSVQEFEVKTGLYGADMESGRVGQFSMITKSGTNDFHGSLYEFLRNDNLDARNFFDRAGRPEFKRNQFGGVIGGPVRVPHLFEGRDHVWFFASYNGMSHPPYSLPDRGDANSRSKAGAVSRAHHRSC